MRSTSHRTEGLELNALLTRGGTGKPWRHPCHRLVPDDVKVPTCFASCLYTRSWIHFSLLLPTCKLGNPAFWLVESDWLLPHWAPYATYGNVSGSFKCILGRYNHGFLFLCVTNKAISAEPVSYARRRHTDTLSEVTVEPPKFGLFDTMRLKLAEQNVISDNVKSLSQGKHWLTWDLYQLPSSTTLSRATVVEENLE